MRKWVLGGIVAIAAVVIWFGWQPAYFMYRVYFHGPGALERIAVSAPTATIAYGPAPQQRAELRLPAGPGPFPIAVLIHGGCWDKETGGNPRQMAPLADTLTKAGVATLNVEYRQVGEPGGGWPGTMRDTGAAIDLVRRLAPHYRLDPARLVVVGHSAGAQLALWSAMRDRLSPGSDLAMPDPLRPAAVVAIDGPGALAEFIGKDAEVCGKPVIVPFMGGTPKQYPTRYADASPQDHLPLGVPQYLSEGAFADLMQPYIERARRAGDRIETYRPDHGKHFDIINSQQEQGQGTVALILRAVRALRPATRLSDARS